MKQTNKQTNNCGEYATFASSPSHPARVRGLKQTNETGDAMSRLRISKEKKAKPIPISLRPEHVVMLAALEEYYKKNRSKVIQILLEEKYKELKL